jgi:hypothetical protein
MFKDVFKRPRKVTMLGSKTFDKAVATFFKPIAQKHGLPLLKIEDCIYEMPSPYFILRIGLLAGHNRSISATLRQVSLRNFVDRVVGIQYDIGWLLRFNGEDTEPFHFLISDDNDILRKVQMEADATERFGIPYILGLKDDFESVKEFAKREVETRMERMRQTRPKKEIKLKNVRQEWPVVIPRQKGDEWETVNELKAADIRFLGDLDGQKEHIFKERLAELFQHDQSVERAYLTRIIGQGLPANGVLCLRRQSGFDKGIRKNLGEIFANVFSLQDNFQLLFLSDEQESLLAKVCRPFFQRNSE